MYINDAKKSLDLRNTNTIALQKILISKLRPIEMKKRVEHLVNFDLCWSF